MQRTLDDDDVLMISSNAREGGGIAAFDGRVCGVVDNLRTQGLALRGGRFFRALAYSEQPRPVCDLLVYDERGVLRYHRLDDVWEVHDVLPRDGHTLVVATGQNIIYRAGDGGDISTWFRTGLPEDTWHLNCLTEVNDEVYATAFGMLGERPRSWDRHPPETTGVLLRMPDAQAVLSGLHQPHTPRRVGDTWVLCNSGNGTLDAYDDAGRLLRRAELPGYPRGLAIGQRAIFVGSSAHRHMHSNRPPGTVTILDPDDWHIVGAFNVAWSEIYDLAIVPRAILAGVANGFRTNSARVREEDQVAMFAAAGVQPQRLWAIGEPLPHGSLRATLRATVPSAMEPRDILKLPCRVTNRGDALFVTAAPNPIHLCYRWYDESNEPVGAGDWLHTPLSKALAPNESIDTELVVQAPDRPGRYTLAATLLQENVAWFDDVDPSNGLRTAVDVG